MAALERIRHFDTAWRVACKAAGCPGSLIHDMRRSAMRTFERSGVPRSVAMSIVGHKTESIYRRDEGHAEPDNDAHTAISRSRLRNLLRDARCGPRHGGSGRAAARHEPRGTLTQKMCPCERECPCSGTQAD